jgi:hypothetical protein
MITILVAPVYATSIARAQSDGGCSLPSSFLGLPTWYKYLETEIDESGKCSPILSGSSDSENPEDNVTQSKVNSALPIGLAVLEAMLRLAGMVAVIMIFVAGFRFITSDGSPDKAAGARKTVINAIIGLVIVVLSTGLVSFIGRTLD